MARLDMVEILILVALLFQVVAYFTQSRLWGVKNDSYGNGGANANEEGKTRNFVKKMNELGKNCIIFFGSQTGTAEDYASRLAKEGKSRFGLETMVADLEDYDFDNLNTLPQNTVAMFVLATYGEGEPTDNAVDFYDFITAKDVLLSTSTDPPLGNLKFVAFGLGNNTYEHFNAVVRNVSSALDRLGAHRIGTTGEGNDGAGTMEEDFLAWKDLMWTALAEKMGLQESEVMYEPVFSIVKRDITKDSPEVYLGEPNKMHLQGTANGPYNIHNPYIAPIIESRELFTAKDRNCLHLEIDISSSNLSYQTGDHIAIWPTNSGKEVDRFLNITGLWSQRDTVINIEALDPTAKVPFPIPTTYDTIVRYYMEICGPVSRQFVSTLAIFAPEDSSKAEMTKLGADKDYFSSQIGKNLMNIAQVLEHVGRSQKWSNIPFSAFIEGLNKVQPRYYSISSSSLAQKNKISITTVVESRHVPNRTEPLKGVTTNYLLALMEKQHNNPEPESNGLAYQIYGPRNKYHGFHPHIPVHIRHSNFRLPSDFSKPIIMVGPGSGVAPFRGFVQERATQAKAGASVGRTLLFFGCRNKSHDFLYASEWEEYKKALRGNFELITAFSREGAKKVYVQHCMRKHAEEINRLLLQKATFYICGDAAHMAREVNAVLCQIISKQRGISEARGEEIVREMRAVNQYQEDVWS